MYSSSLYLLLHAEKKSEFYYYSTPGVIDLLTTRKGHRPHFEQGCRLCQVQLERSRVEICRMVRAVEMMNCIVLCYPSQWEVGRRMCSSVYMVKVGKGICWPRVEQVVSEFVWIVCSRSCQFKEVVFWGCYCLGWLIGAVELIVFLACVLWAGWLMLWWVVWSMMSVSVLLWIFFIMWGGEGLWSSSFSGWYGLVESCLRLMNELFCAVLWVIIWLRCLRCYLYRQCVR